MKKIEMTDLELNKFLDHHGALDTWECLGKATTWANADGVIVALAIYHGCKRTIFTNGDVSPKVSKNVTIKFDGQEYRVPHPDGREVSAHYTDDKADALDTFDVMWKGTNNAPVIRRGTWGIGA